MGCEPRSGALCRCRWRQRSHLYRNIVILVMAVLLKTAGAQSQSQQEDVAEGDISVCFPEDVLPYLPPISAAFKKLIPQFNPNSVSIQFRTDERISIDATDPSLVPFLVQYPSLVATEVSRSSTNDAKFRAGMTIFFTVEYGRFLSSVGNQIGCFSVYVGASDFSAIQNLEQLTTSMAGQCPLAGRGGLKKIKIFPGATGMEMADKLRLTQSTPSFHQTYDVGEKEKEACDKIFLTLKDDTVVANFPTLDLASRAIWIPISSSAFNIYNTNVTREIASYFSQGVACLEDISMKKNFTATIVKWMSGKLIPQIIQSPKCIPGFPGIIRLMVSIDKYRNALIVLDRRSYEDYEDYGQPLRPEEPYFGPVQRVHGRTTTEAPEGFLGASGSGIVLLFLLILILVCCCCIFPCYMLYKNSKIRRLWNQIKTAVKEVFSSTSMNDVNERGQYTSVPTTNTFIREYQCQDQRSQQRCESEEFPVPIRKKFQRPLPQQRCESEELPIIQPIKKKKLRTKRERTILRDQRTQTLQPKEPSPCPCPPPKIEIPLCLEKNMRVRIITTTEDDDQCNSEDTMVRPDPTCGNVSTEMGFSVSPSSEDESEDEDGCFEEEDTAFQECIPVDPCFPPKSWIRPQTQRRIEFRDDCTEGRYQDTAETASAPAVPKGHQKERSKGEPPSRRPIPTPVTRPEQRQGRHSNDTAAPPAVPMEHRERSEGDPIRYPERTKGESIYPKQSPNKRHEAEAPTRNVLVVYPHEDKVAERHGQGHGHGQTPQQPGPSSNKPYRKEWSYSNNQQPPPHPGQGHNPDSDDESLGLGPAPKPPDRKGKNKTTERRSQPHRSAF